MFKTKKYGGTKQIVRTGEIKIFNIKKKCSGVKQRIVGDINYAIFYSFIKADNSLINIVY
jgi:hypothetical protein